MVEKLYTALRNNRISLILALVWLVAALPPIRTWVPSALYIVPALLVICGLIADGSVQRPAVHRWLLMMVVFSVGFQVLIWQARGTYHPRPDIGWLDDHSYWKESVIIADWWGRGIHPSLSQKGGAPYLGTLHTAWHRIVAAGSFVFGQNAQALLCTNLLFVALMPLAAYGCGRDWARLAGLRAVHRSGLLSAALTILYPAGVYYGAFLLKDLATAVTALIALWAVLRFLVHAPGAWLLIFASLFFLFPLRAYTALAVIGVVVPLALARFTLGTLIQVILLGALSVYMGLFHDRLGRILEQLVFSLVNNMPQDLLSVNLLLKHGLSGTLRALMAPYPWVVAEGNFGNYEVYFGQWFLFLIGYPLAACAAVYALRRNQVVLAAPLIMGGLGLSVLIIAYGGNITRQRYFVDLWLLTLAGPGFHVDQTTKRRVFAVVIIGILLFAAAQLTRLLLIAGRV